MCIFKFVYVCNWYSYYLKHVIKMLLLRLNYFYLGNLFRCVNFNSKKGSNGINFVNNFINTFSIRFSFDFSVINKHYYLIIYPVLMMVFSLFIYLFIQRLFTRNRLKLYRYVVNKVLLMYYLFTMWYEIFCFDIII